MVPVPTHVPKKPLLSPPDKSLMERLDISAMPICSRLFQAISRSERPGRCNHFSWPNLPISTTSITVTGKCQSTSSRWGIKATQSNWCPRGRSWRKILPVRSGRSPTSALNKVDCFQRRSDQLLPLARHAEFGR